MKCSIIFTIIWLTLIHNIDARVIRVKGPQRSNKSFHHLCNVDKDGSHIPYPNDCSKFIHCDKFHAFIKQCPEGTLFDNNINICNYEHLVICPYISKESEINTGGRKNDILDEEARGFSGKPIINNINDLTPKSTVKRKIEEFQDDFNDYDSAEEDTNVQVNDFIENKESSGRSDVIQNEVTDNNEIEYEANTTTTKTTKNIKEMETIDITSTPTDITTEPINTTSIDAINKPIDTVTTEFIDTTTDLDDPTFIETKTNPIDTTTKSIHTTKTVLIDSTTEPNDITTNATNELNDTRFEPNNTTTTLILDTTTQSIDTTTSNLINATTTEPVDIAFESVDTNTDIESMTTTESVIISGDEITDMTQDPTEYIDDISEPDHSTNEPINTTFESLAINTDIEYMTTIEPVIISGDEVSEMAKDQTEYIDDVSEPDHSINQPITTTFESVAINTDIESMTTTEPVIISGDEITEMTQDPTEYIDDISESVAINVDIVPVTTPEPGIISEDEVTKMAQDQTEYIDDISEPDHSTNQPITTTFESVVINTDIEYMTTTEPVTISEDEVTEMAQDPTEYVDDISEPDHSTNQPITTTFESVAINANIIPVTTTEPVIISEDEVTEMAQDPTEYIDDIFEQDNSTKEPITITFDSVAVIADIESMTTTEPGIISEDEVTEMAQDQTEYIDDIFEQDNSTNEPITTTFDSAAINTDIENMTTTEPVIISGDEVTETVQEPTEYIDDISEPDHSTNQPITTTFDSVAFIADIESMTTTEPGIISENEVTEMVQDPTEYIDDIFEQDNSTNEPITTTFDSVAINTDIESMTKTEPVIMSEDEVTEMAQDQTESIGVTFEQDNSTNEPITITFDSVDIESMTTTEPVIISEDEVTEMAQDPTEYIDDISEPDHSTNEPITTTFESFAINEDIEPVTTTEPVIISGDEVTEIARDLTDYIDDISEPNHSMNELIPTTVESVAINADIESMTTTEPVIISENEVVEMGQDSKEFIDYISELVDSTKEPIVTTTEQFVTTTEHIDSTNYLIESETNINAESENEYFGAAIELIDNTFNFEPTEPQTSTEIEPVDGIAEIMLPEIMSEMISTKIFNFIKENKQKALNDVIVHIDEDDYLLEPEVQIVQVDENAIKATVKVPNDMTGSLKFHVEVKELNKKQNQVLFVKALTDIVSRQLNQTLLPNDTIKLSISSVDEQSKTTEDSVLSWILDAKKKDNDVYNDYVDKSLVYKKHEIPLPYVRTEKLSWNWEK